MVRAGRFLDVFQFCFHVGGLFVHLIASIVLDAPDLGLLPLFFAELDLAIEVTLSSTMTSLKVRLSFFHDAPSVGYRSLYTVYIPRERQT